MTPYREKLWPAVWLYLATALVIPASILVFTPIDLRVGIAVAVVLYGACVAALIIGAPVVEVTSTEFIAGRARLPLSLVGTTAGFSGLEARDERGPRLDARAWLLIRGWIDPVVKVDVTDAADPAPYWLVSTRHPESVVAALQAATSAAKHTAD